MPGSRVLILGFGELGFEVVKSIANHPQRNETEVAVLLRSKRPEQLRAAQEWKVQVVHGDVVNDTLDSLATTFRDFPTVICCTGMYAPPETQIKIVRAVLAAGVQRYVPWQFGIDYDIIGRGSSQNLFDGQLDVRDLLRAQDRTKWVILSTGMFISFLFEPVFGLVNADRSVVMGIGSWENEITVTAPQDIGRVVAEIVMVHPEVEGVVYCSGDTISMRRLGDVVDKIKGQKAERVLKTVPELKAELARSPDDSMRKYRVVFAEGRGVAWNKEESFNSVNGIATETVEDWASKNM